MITSRSDRSAATVSKKISIQSILVFLFFISVVTNIIILVTSHAREDDMGTYLDPWAASLDRHANATDLSRDDSVANKRGYKLKSLTSLKECVRKKMTSNGKTTDFLPSMFAAPSYKNIAIPPVVDQSMMRSFSWTLQREAQRIRAVFKFLSRPIINRHDFSYIHNPKDACFKRQIDLVIAIPSSPEHMESRERTRQGLKGSYSFVKSNNSTLLFFLGKSANTNKSRKFQVDINMEMRMFGDIVQETFIDVYHNLTLKAMSVMKWIDRYCPHAQFVIKADDDVGIKPVLAVSALQRYREKYGNFILGHWNPMMNVLRNESAKTYVSFQDYPDYTFPPHLLGGAMGFPVTTVRLLFQAALRLKPIWLDDVFISSLCASKVNVPVFMDADFDFKHKEW